MFFAQFRKSLLHRIVTQMSTKCNYHGVQRIKGPPVNSNVSIVIKRDFFSLFRRPTKQQLRIKDKIPDNYVLIYRNTTDRYLFLSQIISGVSAVIIVVITLLSQSQGPKTLPFTDNNPFGVRLRETENELYVYCAVFVVIYVVLQLLIKQMPVRIYYYPEMKRYIGIFYGNAPFTMKRLQFHIGEVTQVSKDGNFPPWIKHQFEVKDQKRIILLDNYFRRPADLFIMLGEQKDPDLEENEFENQ